MENRFVREATLALALNHPNIINVYYVDETARIHFIAMVTKLTKRD